MLRKYGLSILAVVTAISLSAFTAVEKKQAAVSNATETNYWWFTVSSQANPSNLIPASYDGNGQVSKAVEQGPLYSNCTDQTSTYCRYGYTDDQLNFSMGVPTSVKSVAGQYEQPVETIAYTN